MFVTVLDNNDREIETISMSQFLKQYMGFDPQGAKGVSDFEAADFWDVD